MEQRNKTLYVSKTMKQRKAEDLERITSPYGIQLRVNRSYTGRKVLQLPVKQDMEFRRYMYHVERKRHCTKVSFFSDRTQYQ